LSAVALLCLVALGCATRPLVITAPNTTAPRGYEESMSEAMSDAVSLIVKMIAEAMPR
jgi:hypothetical protein